MKNLYKFNYFGLDLSVTAADFFFLNLIKNKFGSYGQKATHRFEKRKIVVSFTSIKNIPQIMRKSIISSSSSSGKNKLFINHNYLSTKSLIVTEFKNSDIINIKILFKSSLLFNFVNFLTNNLLRHQLFQNIIKLYIEQSLLWNLATKFDLICLHAAAVEKNNQVSILAGLNGVGKSTLAISLTQKQNFNLFADNYLLIDKENAYFSPDIVRLPQKSLSYLNLEPKTFFGFNKYTIAQNELKISKTKIADIKSIYLVSRESEWSKQKISKILAKKIIDNLQISSAEEVRFAPVSQFKPEKSFTDVQMPDAEYFKLSLGILEKLNYEF